MGGIGEQGAHLAGDRRELGHGEIGERRLEGGELGAAVFAEHVLARDVGERGVDADEVVGLGPRLQPINLGGQRLGGSVFAFFSFSTIVSASSVRLMRE